MLNEAIVTTHSATGGNVVHPTLSMVGISKHYDAVAARIGVAGERDDLDPFFPSSPSMMPPLEIDTNAEVVFERYRRRRDAFNAQGFFLGRPVAPTQISTRVRGSRTAR